MAVTLEIGPYGSTVMVEPVLRKGLTRRVFRYMADGSLEWAAYDDWRSQHERARFFGFASRELPASMTSRKEPDMHSVLRPNYRRARALALEIEAARVHLDEARSNPSYTLDDIEDLKAELHHLEREFSLTGVTSEYDL